MKYQPKRSCLYMPGANVKALEKAKSLAADVLIFDLEDSVAPEAKASARDNVVAAIAGGGYDGRAIVVRVNALSTPWGEDDVAAAARVSPTAVLFPKIDGGDDIARADAALQAAGAGPDVALWAMVETARAILQIADLAGASKRSRLSTLVMGTNDLAKELRARLTPDRAAFAPALALTVAAARANGVDAVDGVYNDIEDTAGFEAACRQGVEFGFDGKTLIHPSQIETANRAFAPTAEEVARARAVIAAFAAPENAGKGVLRVDGKMTELLHLADAERTVAIAEAIEARSA